MSEWLPRQAQSEMVLDGSTAALKQGWCAGTHNLVVDVDRFFRLSLFSMSVKGVEGVEVAVVNRRDAAVISRNVVRVHMLEGLVNSSPARRGDAVEPVELVFRRYQVAFPLRWLSSLAH
jgi:hypothetical protein